MKVLIELWTDERTMGLGMILCAFVLYFAPPETLTPLQALGIDALMIIGGMYLLIKGRCNLNQLVLSTFQMLLLMAMRLPSVIIDHTHWAVLARDVVIILIFARKYVQQMGDELFGEQDE